MTYKIASDLSRRFPRQPRDLVIHHRHGQMGQHQPRRPGGPGSAQRRWFAPNLVVDGVFGAKTEGAVRIYQGVLSSLLPLQVDRVVGPTTWKALITEWGAH
jgi:hypothetical protein